MASKIGTSSLHWFGRGMAGGLMLIAAANAASFFVRSGGMGNLLNRGTGEDALGFPFEIWRDGLAYSGWMIDYKMVALNLLTGLLVGCVCGMIGVIGKPRFNRMVEELESQERFHRKLKLQFSVKGLMILTTVAAILIAALTTWGSSSHLLAAIYFLGPLALVAIAMSPDSIPWQHRVVILLAVAVTMLGVAISTGLKIGMNFDQVMFGIFVTWTPQSAFAAFVIVVGLIVQIFRRDEVAVGD